jgi:hypothetical protein
VWIDPYLAWDHVKVFVRVAAEALHERLCPSRHLVDAPLLVCQDPRYRRVQLRLLCLLRVVVETTLVLYILVPGDEGGEEGTDKTGEREAEREFEGRSSG